MIPILTNIYIEISIVTASYLFFGWLTIEIFKTFDTRFKIYQLLIIGLLFPLADFLLFCLWVYHLYTNYQYNRRCNKILKGRQAKLGKSFYKS